MYVMLALPYLVIPSAVPPERCPRCGEGPVWLHSMSRRAIRYAKLRSLPVYRFACRACGRTFVPPVVGLSFGQYSDAVLTCALLCYLVGETLESVLDIGLEESAIPRSTFARFRKRVSNDELLRLRRRNMGRRNDKWVLLCSYDQGSIDRAAAAPHKSYTLNGGWMVIRLRGDDIGRATVAWIRQFMARTVPHGERLVKVVKRLPIRHPARRDGTRTVEGALDTLVEFADQVRFTRDHLDELRLRPP